MVKPEIVAGFSVTSGTTYQTARSHNLEGYNLNLHPDDNITPVTASL
jgi:hypothetical protein